MMKLVIFAAVAISVCLSKSSKSSDLNSLSRTEVEILLRSRFALTPADLKNECQVDFERAWPKIGAAFDRVMKAEDDVTQKAEDEYSFSDNKTGEYASALLEKSKTYNKATKDVIDAALPCASEEKKAKIIEFAKDQIFHPKAELSK